MLATARLDTQPADPDIVVEREPRSDAMSEGKRKT
jgi:hypothetical protein